MYIEGEMAGNEHLLLPGLENRLLIIIGKCARGTSPESKIS